MRRISACLAIVLLASTMAVFAHGHGRGQQGCKHHCANCEESESCRECGAGRCTGCGNKQDRDVRLRNQQQQQQKQAPAVLGRRA